MHLVINAMNYTQYLSPGQITVGVSDQPLYAIKKEMDDLYAKPDFSDADSERVGELQIKFEEMNGWNADRH